MNLDSGVRQTSTKISSYDEDGSEHVPLGAPKKNLENGLV